MYFPRILEVARIGHPVLVKPAEKVEDPSSLRILHLIEDMKATVCHLNATGLAAPQVFIPLRLIVYRLRPPHTDSSLPKDQYTWTVMINPTLQETSTSKTTCWESCLSIPDLAGWVPRYDAVTCQYLTLEGETVTKKAKGYEARVIQHECDHINGLLYPHHIKDFHRFGFRKELQLDEKEKR